MCIGRYSSSPGLGMPVPRSSGQAAMRLTKPVCHRQGKGRWGTVVVGGPIGCNGEGERRVGWGRGGRKARREGNSPSWRTPTEPVCMCRSVVVVQEGGGGRQVRRSLQQGMGGEGRKAQACRRAKVGINGQVQVKHGVKKEQRQRKPGCIGRWYSGPACQLFKYAFIKANCLKKKLNSNQAGKNETVCAGGVVLAKAGTSVPVSKPKHVQRHGMHVPATKRKPMQHVKCPDRFSLFQSSVCLKINMRVH